MDAVQGEEDVSLLVNCTGLGIAEWIVHRSTDCLSFLVQELRYCWMFRMRMSTPHGRPRCFEVSS